MNMRNNEVQLLGIGLDAVEIRIGNSCVLCREDFVEFSTCTCSSEFQLN